MKIFLCHSAHVQFSEGETIREEEYDVVLNTFEDHLQLYVKGPRPWVKRSVPQGTLGRKVKHDPSTFSLFIAVFVFNVNFVKVF